jgi:hypothetical protein
MGLDGTDVYSVSDKNLAEHLNVDSPGTLLLRVHPSPADRLLGLFLPWLEIGHDCPFVWESPLVRYRQRNVCVFRAGDCMISRFVLRLNHLRDRDSLQ